MVNTSTGVGAVKAGGNYASDIVPAYEAKAKGYPIALYLDSLTHTTVEEFSTSNFVGIRGNTYITPESPSVLDSVTNRVLAQCAKDMGLTVERRPVPYAEVMSIVLFPCSPALIVLVQVETFDEVGAVGTAVVVTPLTSLTRGNKKITFPTFATLQKLRNHVLAVQCGDAADSHRWLHDV